MPSIINATLTNGLVTSADNSGSLQLQTNNGTTAVTIDTSQNVAVGTTTALATASGRGNITINGSSGSILSFGTGGSLRSYIFQDSTTMYINNSSSGSMNFDVNGTERMRITSGGDLLVGTTTSRGRVSVERDSNDWCYNSNQTGSGTKAHIRFMDNGTAVGNIISSGSTTTYATSSDYRLKENVAPMTGALAKVQSLNPVTYNWKVNGSAGQGFIAHELQAIVPDCVVGEKDAVDENGEPKYQMVDTSFLVATLTAAIQELKAELDATKAEVQALKEGKQ